MKKAVCLLPLSCQLAEGCVWDGEKEILYFVDIDGCMLYSYMFRNQQLKSYFMGGPVGCVALCKDGGLVAAVKDTLLWINPKSGEKKILLHHDFPDYLRYNDGKCGPDGSLWAGTMAMDQRHPKAVGGGMLYCISDNQIRSEYEGYTIPNGLAFNGDGSIFYHIDTALHRIDQMDIFADGILEHRRAAAEILPEWGDPDGMCIDEEGNLWVAMWGGGKVICINPQTGQKLDEIFVADRYVTCCCFGGKDLKTLFITTARDEEGKGGQVFAVEMEVKGTLPYRYGGGVLL